MRRLLPVLLLPVLALSAAPAAAAPAPPLPRLPASTLPPAGRPSPVAATAERWLRTMTRTRYRHHYTIDTVSGVYEADCVGLADAVVRRSAPRAWSDLHRTLGIRRGYVPRPGRWWGFLTGAEGALPPTWQRVTQVASLRPGDLLLMDSNPATRFVGHAVIIAGTPRRLPDATYAVRVIDATSSPHGSADSRRTDARAVDGTGLGAGTMRLQADARGRIARGWWSVDGHGPSMRGVRLAAGRALA